MSGPARNGSAPAWNVTRAGSSRPGHPGWVIMAGVTDAPGEYQLYRELAGWWPLISPPAEYAADAAVLQRAFAAALVPVRTVLDLGSGGGHVAMYLRESAAVTLVDISPDMIAASRELIPECEHVQADMLTVRLGRLFDAVLVHDAADYVTTQDELAMLAATAFAHCRPGGVAVFAPDHTAETFRPGRGGGGGSDGAGRQASFRERTRDPDPGDEWIESAYEFTLRSADGDVRVIRETHRLGAFRQSTWLRVLAEAGFEPEPGDVAPAYAGPAASGLKHLFIGHRPAPETVGTGG
jgi:SAM-dependent methyltransferase